MGIHERCRVFVVPLLSISTAYSLLAVAPRDHHMHGCDSHVLPSVVRKHPHTPHHSHPSTVWHVRRVTERVERADRQECCGAQERPPAHSGNFPYRLPSRPPVPSELECICRRPPPVHVGLPRYAQRIPTRENGEPPQHLASVESTVLLV
jgi:hypothetical protein